MEKNVIEAKVDVYVPDADAIIKEIEFFNGKKVENRELVIKALCQQLINRYFSIEYFDPKDIVSIE